jgi:hypothetical protein
MIRGHIRQGTEKHGEEIPDEMYRDTTLYQRSPLVSLHRQSILFFKVPRYISNIGRGVMDGKVRYIVTNDTEIVG